MDSPSRGHGLTRDPHFAYESDNYQNALRANQKEIEALQDKLQAANEREAAAEQTIAKLRAELETYRPVTDSAKAEPTTLTEPQPEPMTVPADGGTDGSSNGTNGQ